MRADEHPLYDAWSQMRQRCKDPNHPAYSYYGGRGVHVCAQWRNFWVFVSDMGPRPSPRHTIDRYPDNDGPCAPSNCRWATRKQQSQNSRRPHFIRHAGIRLCISDWAKCLGITPSALTHRIKIHGPHAAISRGGKNSGNRRFITHDGTTLGPEGWADKLGITTVALYERIRNHGVEKAIRMGYNTLRKRKIIKLSKGESLTRRIVRK